MFETYPTKNLFNDKTSGRVIAWFSGGVASAIACKIALYKFDNVECVFCDTHLENEDTYRFMSDFEKALGITVTRIHSERMYEPEDVWYKYNGLNFAHGAPCSMVLKKEPRIKFQKIHTDFGQVFGFDYSKKEEKRARNLATNNPELNAMFPLIVEKYDRARIFEELEVMGIKPPLAYNYFINNNCLGNLESPKGGCIQGGIGYWQKMKEIFPLKFEYMANIEHDLSQKNGKPITICKDQSKNNFHKKVFLKPNPDFPELKSIADIKGKKPVGFFECNGLCSTIEGE
jgi:hypothetical protein